MIVTDHHLPEAELPPALAVLNPNRPDCPYPEKNLCGAGVAFKLVQALLAAPGLAGGEGAPRLRVVPQAGGDRDRGRRGAADRREPHHRVARTARSEHGAQSRTARAAGCRRLHRWTRAPNARQVAFQIAPRINAAGRMDTAKAVVELFLTNDAARARDLAKQLHDQNAERQQVEAEIRETCEGRSPWTTANARWSTMARTGIAACWASWPAAWWSACTGRSSCSGRNAEDGLASGSGRSIPAFHLLDALESMSELFVRFGGHAHAAGVTMEAARVEEFRAPLQRIRRVASLRPTIFCAAMEIDAVLELREINEQAIEESSRWRRSVTATRRRCSPRSTWKWPGPRPS